MKLVRKKRNWKMDAPRKKQDVKILRRTAAEVLEERSNVELLPEGTPIDELIGGGIEKGEVVEFYGERAGVEPLKYENSREGMGK